MRLITHNCYKNRSLHLGQCKTIFSFLYPWYHMNYLKIKGYGLCINTFSFQSPVSRGITVQKVPGSHNELEAYQYTRRYLAICSLKDHVENMIEGTYSKPTYAEKVDSSYSAFLLAIMTLKDKDQQLSSIVE